MTQINQNLNITRSYAVARRQKGITQSELAHQIQCKQSAISMFERGNTQALSLEKQKAVADALGIPWIDEDAHAQNANIRAGFCPHFDCPSNLPYYTNGQILLLPEKSDQNEAFCRYCGEVRETTCGSCGTAYTHGACCVQCGTPFVPVAEMIAAETSQAWILQQQHTISLVRRH